MKEKTVIEHIKEYFETNEMIKDDETVYADYLPEGSNKYAIYNVSSQSPEGRNINTYIGGSTLREHTFVFATRFTYSTALDMVNIANSGFYEKLEDWVENNTRNGIFPNVEGADNLKVISTGNLHSVDPSNRLAEYQMTLKLFYNKEVLLTDLFE